MATPWNLMANYLTIIKLDIATIDKRRWSGMHPKGHCLPETRMSVSSTLLGDPLNMIKTAFPETSLINNKIEPATSAVC